MINLNNTPCEQEIIMLLLHKTSFTGFCLILLSINITATAVAACRKEMNKLYRDNS